MSESAHRITFFNPLIYTYLSVAAPTTSMARSPGINGCQALILHYHTQNLWKCCCGCFFTVFYSIALVFFPAFRFSCWRNDFIIALVTVKISKFVHFPHRFQWMDGDVTVIATSIFLQSEPFIYGYACVRLNSANFPTNRMKNCTAWVLLLGQISSSE